MRAFRLINLPMAALFVFAAAVQYNDPDPLRWMALYLAAAAACGLAAAGRLPRWLPAAVGLAALAWAAALAPGVWGRVRPGDLFAEWEMANTAVEEARETGGLLIVAAWMLVLAVVPRGWRRADSPA
ncbi:MAG TPA: transmembrane 220 family protein [Longimicrobium sp.]|jgi:hypothetical protein